MAVLGTHQPLMSVKAGSSIVSSTKSTNPKRSENLWSVSSYRVRCWRCVVVAHLLGLRSITSSKMGTAAVVHDNLVVPTTKLPSNWDHSEFRVGIQMPCNRQPAIVSMTASAAILEGSGSSKKRHHKRRLRSVCPFSAPEPLALRIQAKPIAKHVHSLVLVS